MTPASTPARVAASDVEASRSGNVRILIVDDEQSMRDMLRIVLRRDGYDVSVANSGRDAIEQLRQNQFDLLLSDIKMPDISGVDVLRAAKEINRDVVAFMMTAYASTSTAVECTSARREPSVPHSLRRCSSTRSARSEPTGHAGTRIAHDAHASRATIRRSA